MTERMVYNSNASYIMGFPLPEHGSITKDYSGRDRLTLCCLMPFSKVFQLYFGGQCTDPCFPGVLLTSTLHTILSNPQRLLSHITIVKRMDSSERGMNPVEGKILAEPRIVVSTSCSQVLYTTN